MILLHCLPMMGLSAGNSLGAQDGIGGFLQRGRNTMTPMPRGYSITCTKGQWIVLRSGVAMHGKYDNKAAAVMEAWIFYEREQAK